MRLFATIQQTDIHSPTRHFSGLPPLLQANHAAAEPLAWPCVAIISTDSEGVFLDRFADNGLSAGDTWHQSVDDAKAQALVEYNGALSSWIEMPSDLDDDAAIDYALARAREM